MSDPLDGEGGGTLHQNGCLVVVVPSLVAFFLSKGSESLAIELEGGRAGRVLHVEHKRLALLLYGVVLVADRGDVDVYQPAGGLWLLGVVCGRLERVEELY